MRATKTIVPLSDGQKALYIHLLDFESEEEQNIIFSKVQQLIKEWKSKRKVFG